MDMDDDVAIEGKGLMVTKYIGNCDLFYSFGRAAGGDMLNLFSAMACMKPDDLIKRSSLLHP